MKTIEDIFKTAEEKILERNPYCLKHYKYLQQEEIDFKLCFKQPCIHYRVLDGIDVNNLMKLRKNNKWQI